MGIRDNDRVGVYEVLRRIAAGGTAEVWEVRHTALGSRHALKVLLSHLVERDDVRQRFLREGQLQSSLDHPGIVRVTDIIAEPGVAGLVMDFLEGEALDEVLERRGAIPAEEARTWLCQILDAIGHAHAHGVIHRDLKPANLFLTQTRDGPTLKVLDFGIAKIHDQRQTGTQATLGTAAFMSPEQVANPAAVDHRTDIFSLGAVLYELVTRTNAFEGATSFDTMQRVVAGTYRPASEVIDDLPSWVDAVIARAFAVDPDDRFQDVEAFREAMFAEVPAVAATPSAPIPAPRSLSLLFKASGVSAVLLVGMGAFAWWSTHRPLLHDAQLTVNSCGLWELEVHAQGGGHDLTVSQDGEALERRPISGDHSETYNGRSAPNRELVVDVGFPGGPSLRRTTTVPSFDGVLKLPPTLRWHEGKVPSIPVRIQTPCALPRGLRWTATIGSDSHKGDVSAGRFVLPTSNLTEGAWPLALDVYMGDEPLLTHASTIQVTAPCVDKDSDGYSTCQGDCDDSRADIHPGVSEIPGDGLDNDCAGGDGLDADGDGHMAIATGGDDCDDNNRNIHPGATESASPNGKDDNCNGTTDEGTVAYDDDGDGYSERDGDCNDDDTSAHPNATELPDCRDQDCDGEIDEGVTLATVDDGYESNDVRPGAFDLETGSEIAFDRVLSIVTRGTTDEEWFRFHSDDGTFDSWGIDIIADALPIGASFSVEIHKSGGRREGVGMFHKDGDTLSVRGQGFFSDSGDYLLRVVPKRLAKPWCPAKIRVVSR